nr:MAG TPA: Suppressor of IKBKE 1, Striatin-3-coil domain, heterotrimer, PROTEIN BINDING.75A [Caudoviricetes sp.]
MNNEIIYKIEKEDLILDYYFNNLKIGSINGGRVENILNKCKLYDEEYETLLKETEYMKHIAKDFEQLQQENKQLKTQINEYQKALDETMSEKIDIEDNWNKLKEYIKNEIPEDVFIDTEWFVAILDKMQELERSDSNVKD